MLACYRCCSHAACELRAAGSDPPCRHPPATRGPTPGLRRAAPSIAAAQADTELKARALRMARESLSAAGGGGGGECKGEEQAEYDGGFVVMWGEDHLKVGSGTGGGPRDEWWAAGRVVACGTGGGLQDGWRRLVEGRARLTVGRHACSGGVGARVGGSGALLPYTAAATLSCSALAALTYQPARPPPRPHARRLLAARRTRPLCAAPRAPTSCAATSGCGAATPAAAATGGSTGSAGSRSRRRSTRCTRPERAARVRRAASFRGGAPPATAAPTRRAIAGRMAACLVPARVRHAYPPHPPTGPPPAGGRRQVDLRSPGRRGRGAAAAGGRL